MSAITGIHHLNKGPVPGNHGYEMMKSLQKYPCNDAMLWQQKNIFLGCHSQWITPESIDEVLPFYDSERELAITADAIIDNREELFDRLGVNRSKRQGFPDSQLILLAYQKWGEESPKYLNGDFAFMIWDGKQQKLFGARDFSGARTLYYYNHDEWFAFCTVIDALFTLPYIDKELNEEWLAEYLAIPNMIDSVDTATTVFKHINQVPPSHTIRIVEGKVTVRRYNALLIKKRIKFKRDEEYIEAFREIFQKAVDARIRTYLSVGSHLSGGLDSGSVASFAAKSLQMENKKLHTFSYVPKDGFKDWTPKHRVADERPYIKSTVQYVRNIEDNYLSFNQKSPLTEMDDWLEIMEMPYKFFENSVWVKGFHEYASEKGIGILLNGARGNLGISWGPALDYYAVLLKRFKWVRLYHEINAYSKKIGVTNKSRLFSVVLSKAFPSLRHLSRTNKSYQFPMIINSDFAKRTNILERLEDYGIQMDGAPKLNLFNVRQNHFLNDYMWNTTGTTDTKLSLHYGLWQRDPTNDIRVIQFCLSLPEEQYVHDGIDRALIRRATEGYLPDDIRLNQKVRGIQGADWVYRLAPKWNGFVEELNQLVRDSTVSEFMAIDVIQSILSKVEKGPREEYAFDPEIRVLMRSLIVYRFLRDKLL